MPLLSEITLTQPDGERVSLHLQQSSRGLELRVGTADDGTRQLIRANLGELMQRVEEQGLGTIWPPVGPGTAGYQEPGDRNRQHAEPDPEGRRGRRVRGPSTAERGAFTDLLGLGSSDRKDSE